jgi:hypothetical protein
MVGIMENVYRAETSLATASFEGACDASRTGIIPRTGFQQKIVNTNNTGYPQDDIKREGNNRDFFISPLSGQSIKKEAFHDNMIPFIKNKNQQNMNYDTNSNKLGRLTGNDETYRQKKHEVKSFFDITPNNSYVYGSPSFTETVGLDRYVPSQKRQGEKPFQDIRVGPGLAAGYTAEPVGGLNQANARDYILPKCIDELRVLTNPKITYEGRVIAGLKSGQRGLQAKPFKHRPERYYNSEPERGNLSSAIKASKLREKFYMKPTEKQKQRSYYGVLGNTEIRKPRKEGAYRRSTKNNYMNPTPRNAYREDAWTINEDANTNGIGDYGLASIENKANERDTTQNRQHFNNLTISVKKLITPITDFFRRTRKENFIGNVRPEGNMNARMPSKQTVYNPDDITRTTIKEQTIENDYTGQLTGPKQNIVYDPNDIARTTIKEQNINNNAPYINMNPQNPRSLRVYDPEDIARTTMKEITIDNEHIGFVGFQESLKPGGYTSTSVDMKNTNRQFLTDWYYQGIADGETGTGPGRGYLAAQYEAKNTNRQFLNDWEWEGPAKSNFNNPESYDSMYNARMNPNREEIALGREPTPQSVKLNAGGDLVNIDHKRIEGDQINIREPAETFIYEAPPQKNSCGITRMKPKLPEDTQRERINPEILNAYRQNPYTQPLFSSVFP